VKLAIIAGDGIGPEVVGEAVKVLDAVVPGVEKTSYDLGARRYHATGEVLPDSVIGELRGHDAILLGAIGDPSVPSGVLERGLLLRIRFALDHHVNLRPSRLYPGVDSPLAGNPDIPIREPAERFELARPTRSLPKSVSTRRSVCDVWCTTRSAVRSSAASI
jgi:3-isopropylmalate dehydrogenase